MNIVKLLVEYKHYYLIGIKTTLLISFLSLIIGSTLGALLSLLKLSKVKPLRFISTAYIEIVRGTPIMVQIALVYFGSYVILGTNMDGFLAALIAVSLNSAAYVAEIIRSGIQSIDKGQLEASRSLGLSNSQTMKYIIMPQAIRNILPALGNEFVTLIKETSVASTIGVADLMYASKIVQSSSFQPFNPLIIVAIIYFIITFSLSQLVGLLERRLVHND
ncbi:amino acid ABC transporter permease [Anaerosalibacter bizertensis]|uniref:Amino acid ABC transporter permease n=1 Tax=Anaerosalibacter bizertensis TaxID=932217 RepID=A0A9Q4FM74_9FIRM|nr:amino acid ABC transporter permease [Anaerosalibacter bizertensis]MCB5559934.1 amino acid ABC transporter permease [Anaerosalibacter bizertensis]MCG4565477.1 amino acid ABC transporter permease [Anaerosalibacter bizertensis]MCG4582840.1 amino acid ABC transporter permease [Anaerosalibacter bizertensis]MCG4583894.1 amino acid ABC transporter permease [Anaerosalibacter bizertensis]